MSTQGSLTYTRRFNEHDDYYCNALTRCLIGSWTLAALLRYQNVDAVVLVTPPRYCSFARSVKWDLGAGWQV